MSRGERSGLTIISSLCLCPAYAEFLETRKAFFIGVRRIYDDLNMLRRMMMSRKLFNGGGRKNWYRTCCFTPK